MMQEASSIELPTEDVLVPFGNGMVARVAPGTGEKVLWIHGYTFDSSIWQDLWHALPDWYHIGIDLPGHGRSAPFSGEPTISMLARSIGDLALAQGVRHVIGLSFGGLIALQVAIEFPTQFASFTLGAPGLIGGPGDQIVHQRYWELIQLLWRRGPGPWMTELWMQSPPDIFKGAAAHPVLWARLKALIDRHSWDEFRTGVMRNLLQPPQTAEAMARVTTSTLVFVGDEEMPAFKEAATMIEEAMPNCAQVYLHNAGHLCMLEVPDRAAPIIDQHLRANMARSSNET